MEDESIVKINVSFEGEFSLSNYIHVLPKFKKRTMFHEESMRSIDSEGNLQIFHQFQENKMFNCDLISKNFFKKAITRRCNSESVQNNIGFREGSN